MASMVRFEHESCSAVIVLWDDGRATLSSVYSEDRQKGHATALLKKVVAYADENSMNLLLAALAYGDDPRPNSLQLKSFYEKFGFVAHNEKDTEYIVMERKFS